jgi:hypothetical protein
VAIEEAGEDPLAEEGHEDCGVPSRGGGSSRRGRSLRRW